MASAQVVETSVNTNNNPSHDYTTNPDDHSSHNNSILLKSACQLLLLLLFRITNGISRSESRALLLQNGVTKDNHRF